MIILLNQRNINIKYLKAVGIDSMCTYLLIELIFKKNMNVIKLDLDQL